MNFATVCSGIGAPEVAFGPLGWRSVFVSEIERFPREVLRRRFGAGAANGPKLFGDFTRIEREQVGGPVDLLCGGTPCQSFSVAGKRLGLDDARGNLTLEYARLARRIGARFIVWENVPGVLSSDGGRDFGTILAAFAGYPTGTFFEPAGRGWGTGGLVEPAAGGAGYGLAWRVLDAQYFGVPQRRRRVFVVGYLGDWRRAAAVLFEPKGLRGDPAPRREAGQGPAGSVKASAGKRGGVNERECGTLVAGAVSAKWAKGSGGPAGDEHYNLVADPVTAAYAKHGGASAGKDSQIRNVVAMPFAFTAKDWGGDAGEISPTLRAGSAAVQSGGVMPAVAFKPSHFTRGKDGAPGNLAPPLSADADRGDQDAVVALSNRRSGTGDAAETLRSDRLGCCPVADSLTVGANQTTGFTGDVIAPDGYAVRRLTPRECERLQGFPDDHTRIPWKGKREADCPDGPRYRAIGNAMAVPVMRWIGERIDAVERLAPPGMPQANP